MGKFVKRLIQWLNSPADGSDKSPAAEPRPSNEFELQAYLFDDEERARRYREAKRAEIDAEMEGKFRIARMICQTALGLGAMVIVLVALVLAATGYHVKVHGHTISWPTLGFSGLGLTGLIFGAVRWGRRVLSKLKSMWKVTKGKPSTKELPPSSSSPPP